MKIKLALKCDVCSEVNYTTTKNSKNTTEKLKLNKYCSRCQKHTEHKESTTTIKK